MNPLRTSQSEEREEVDALLDEQDDDVFVPNSNTANAVVVSNENNNVISSDCREPLHPEKTTEGVLKAARLGDLHMLTELHQVCANELIKDGATYRYIRDYPGRTPTIYFLLHLPLVCKNSCIPLTKL